MLIDFLRGGDADVVRDVVSLRKLRLSPLYREAISRFPVLLAEYFNRPQLDITMLMNLTGSSSTHAGGLLALPSDILEGILSPVSLLLVCHDQWKMRS
jgi:hypothetical protein